MLILSVLLCFLVIAAWQDYYTGRILNGLVLVMIAAGFALHIWYQHNIFIVFWDMLVFGATFFLFYRMKVFGAGDVKLLAASAVYIGSKLWIVVMLACSLAAVIGTIKLLKRGLLFFRIKTALDYFRQLLLERKWMEYAYGTKSSQAVTVPFACYFCFAYLLCFFCFLG